MGLKSQSLARGEHEARGAVGGVQPSLTFPPRDAFWLPSGMGGFQGSPAP